MKRRIAPPAQGGFAVTRLLRDGSRRREIASLAAQRDGRIDTGGPR
ncbi:MAG TPA: hypothetical protein VHZ25_14980 [Acidobacteriaceae bacterium]|nr:hypothetical protein [Acidobacteriaceae bacterium]